MSTFNDFDLITEIQHAINDVGYTTPTPIQKEAIPHLILKRDLLGIAQTGTGKTAAFSLPILNYLFRHPKRAQSKKPRVLILAPTRELVNQIQENFLLYGKNTKTKSMTIFGGVSENPQIYRLKEGVDVVIATPGRLLDLMNQRAISLEAIEIFVLDEADRMLDMGFIVDIKKIIKLLPKERQTLLFSATMPSTIVNLAGSLLNNPIRVEITPAATTVERIEQRLLIVQKADKARLLRSLLADKTFSKVLVFTRTKHGANKVVLDLLKGHIQAVAIHGNKSQNARERALDDFKDGKVRVLVATDIAARGIDVDDVTHVINYDLPNEPESYVHRIGRTARAGKDGVAISFHDPSERSLLYDIEKAIRAKIPLHPTPPLAPSFAAPVTGGKPMGSARAPQKNNNRFRRRN